MKHPKRILLFLGEEEFLKEKAVSELQKQCALNQKKETGAICHTFRTLDEDFDIKKIIALARTPNLFHPCQIIVIKYIERLKVGDQNALISYIDNPTESTLLVLFSKASARKIGNKSTQELGFLRKLIPKQTHLEVSNFDYLSEQKVCYQVRNWIKEKGKNISDRDISMFVGNVGRNLRQLYRIIEQACLYAGDRQFLTYKDLENFSSGTTTSDIYKILDAVLYENTPYAVEVLKDLYQFNVKPDVIIGTLARELSKIYKAKKLLNKGLSTADIQKKLSIRFYVDKFFASVRKVGSKELESKLKRLLYVDIGIKTGRLKPFSALEGWLFDYNF